MNWIIIHKSLLLILLILNVGQIIMSGYVIGTNLNNFYDCESSFYVLFFCGLLSIIEIIFAVLSLCLINIYKAAKRLYIVTMFFGLVGAICTLFTQNICTQVSIIRLILLILIFVFIVKTLLSFVFTIILMLIPFVIDKENINKKNIDPVTNKNDWDTEITDLHESVKNSI